MVVRTPGGGHAVPAGADLAAQVRGVSSDLLALPAWHNGPRRTRRLEVQRDDGRCDSHRPSVCDDGNALGKAVGSVREDDVFDKALNHVTSSIQNMNVKSPAKIDVLPHSTAIPSKGRNENVSLPPPPGFRHPSMANNNENVSQEDTPATG